MNDFKDKKIAVVGVSNKEEKFGFRIFQDLLNAGYDVEGINLSDGIICGRKIHHDLKELAAAPDLVITVVPPSATERIVEQCRELGIFMIWMQPGSESEKAIALAEQYNIQVMHNGCFMVDMGLW